MAERRILVLSLYFRPDLSAGSFRATALVDALKAQAPDAAIDVITTHPNRYATFSSEAPDEERDGHCTIRRIRLPAHQSGMADQAVAFSRFSRQAASLVRGARYDLVFATSSRLTTAALGAWIARRVGAPLYLDIRDIFVESIGDVLQGLARVPARVAFSAIERWTIPRATRLNLVSRGFAPYFAERYPVIPLSFFSNGIDDEFLPEHIVAAKPRRAAGDPLTVVYAGNMGEGQGLHEIVPALAERLRGRVRFRLIGDGGRRRQLEQSLADRGARDVEVLPPMARAQLIREYVAADVLFLHLNAYDAFKRVLPSKIFEYAALGKPIWAGVAGYAAEFLRGEVTNVGVFPPCDADGAIAALHGLRIEDARRDAFIAKYSRRAITQELARDVLACAGVEVPA